MVVHHREEERWIIGSILVVVLLTTPAGATNYYVSTKGSNSNPGTLDRPFLTIQKAAAKAQPGDQVFVRAGVYRETVAPQRSGTAKAPITFQPHAGEQVTITGLDPVIGWTLHGGLIYRSSVTDGASQVFVNGREMMAARWPNSSAKNRLHATLATVDSASGAAAPKTSTITDAGLDNPSNGTWNGARLAIIPGLEFTTYSLTLTGQTGNTLAFQWPHGGTPSDMPKAGNRYFLDGVLATLDAPNEYYYDSAANTLYLCTTVNANPNSQTVEVRRRDYGFDLGDKSYIKVSGFRLMAASVTIQGSHNLIDNLQILYPSAPNKVDGLAGVTTGVAIVGRYNTVRHSEIAYTGGSGVTISGPYNLIDNNLIHDVGSDGGNSGFVTTFSASTTITNNTMYNSGREGVWHSGNTQNTLIAHNDISRFGFLTKDLGGTYLWGTKAPGTVIAYNYIHDARSPGSNIGIYMDGGSFGVTAHHNLVWNVQYGIAANRPGADKHIYNNTLWNIAYKATYSWDNGKQITNINNYNNLSNKGGWVGTSISNNITSAKDPFVNSAAGDYTLRAGTAPVDAGKVIPGITDGYTGAAPDVGAFESGVTPWTAGAKWKTWLFANQTSAPLQSALYVKPNGTRIDTGTLVAGNPFPTAGKGNRVFLKFDLSGVTRPIQSAVLRLYETDGLNRQNGTATWHRVLAAWNPKTVAYGQSVDNGSSFYDPDNIDIYTDVDVTSIVKAWLNDPSTNFGFSIRGTGGQPRTAKYFGGFYDVTPPLLVITFAGPGR